MEGVIRRKNGEQCRLGVDIMGENGERYRLGVDVIKKGGR